MEDLADILKKNTKWANFPVIIYETVWTVYSDVYWNKYIFFEVIGK